MLSEDIDRGRNWRVVDEFVVLVLLAVGNLLVVLCALFGCERGDLRLVDIQCRIF